MQAVVADARGRPGAVPVAVPAVVLEPAQRLGIGWQLEDGAGRAVEILAARRMAGAFKPGAQDGRIGRRQLGRLAPGGGSQLEGQRIGVLLRALHGGGQCGALGLGLLLVTGSHLDHRFLAPQLQVQGHQQAAGQQAAKVRHIGHALLPQKMLRQLKAHPHRQHHQRGPGGVVEVEGQHVEKADAAHAVEHHIHGHQPGNRARRTQPIAARAGIEQTGKQRGADTGGQVETQVEPGAQRHLQRKTEQKQKHHIAQQVAGAAVQKDGGQRLQGLQAGTGFIAHRPAGGKWLGLQRCKAGAGGLPFGMQRIACLDHLAGQQLAAKTAFLLHQQVDLAVVLVFLQPLHHAHHLRLDAAVRVAALCVEVLHKGRHLDRRQRRMRIGFGGPLCRPLLTPLPDPEYQAVDRNQQHRHPGRRLPGGLVFQRDGDEHGAYCAVALRRQAAAPGTAGRSVGFLR